MVSAVSFFAPLELAVSEFVLSTGRHIPGAKPLLTLQQRLSTVKTAQSILVSQAHDFQYPEMNALPKARGATSLERQALDVLDLLKSCDGVPLPLRHTGFFE